MECYNISGELEDVNLHDLQIPESQGSCALEGLSISSNKSLKSLKNKKVTIGSHENSKFANIGDYWDDKSIQKITDLLHEFQGLFPT